MDRDCLGSIEGRIEALDAERIESMRFVMPALLIERGRERFRGGD